MRLTHSFAGSLQAVCILLGVKPRVARAPRADGTFGKVQEYWSVAKSELLMDSSFLRRVESLDIDNIDPRRIQRAARYTKDEYFTPANVKMCSVAASGRWMFAHSDHHTH